MPGRSVVGAYVDEDVTRKSQVSAQVEVGSGRVVVDRIQTFDGTNPALEGITLGLGAPVPAEVWAFPAGSVGEGATEQIVVFNPTDEVAEVEVEVRLDDPATNGVPEPFEATVAPHRYAIVDLHEPDLEVTETTPKRDPGRRGAQHHRAIPQRGAGRGREGPHPLRAAGQRRRRRHLGRRPSPRPRWLLVAGGVER